MIYGTTMSSGDTARSSITQQNCGTSPAPGRDGSVLSPHNVGLSVLILPAYAIGGVDGVKSFMALIGGVTVTLSAFVALRATGYGWASLVAAGLIGMSAPFFVYSTQIYPEAAAACCLAASVWLLLAPAPGGRAATLLVVALSALAWLGSKYVLIGGMVALLALLRLNTVGRWWLLGLGIPSAAAYVAFQLATYGALTPYSVNLQYAGADTLELVAYHFEVWNRLYRLVALWVDREFGLVRWAPVLLLVLPAVVPLARRHGQARGWSC